MLPLPAAHKPTGAEAGSWGGLAAGDGGDTGFVALGMWQDQGSKAVGLGLGAEFSVGLTLVQGWGVRLEIILCW